VYCSKCGSQISATAGFCAACGQPVSGAVALGTALPSLSPPAEYYPVQAVPVAYTGVWYAGFWLRFIAFVIDGFVRGVLFAVVFIVLLILSGAGAGLSNLGSGDDLGDAIATAIGLGFGIGLLGTMLVVSWLYYALLESSAWQATLGKKMLGLYVTDLSGQRISFARATGRYFSKIVTNLIPLAIGYIMAGFTQKKQAIHDMIASCLVLRRS
jgi:uncharacterized RDD family membrane protein YckC